METPEYKCNICQKKFKSAAGLKTHTVSKKVPCAPQPPNVLPAHQLYQIQQPIQQSQRQILPQQQLAQQTQSQIPEQIKSQQKNQNKSQNNKLEDIPVEDFAKQMENLVASLTSTHPQQNNKKPQSNSQPLQNQESHQQQFNQQNQQLNSNQQIQLRQQCVQQPQQLGNVGNNSNTNTVITKNFLNGNEISVICGDPDYEPMRDYSISPHERFQRLVMKIMNEVTTEDNCRYANLGEPHNLGRFVDRLNKVTGTYCMVNSNNNGRTIVPIMPSQANDDYMCDMYLRNILSEVREEQRQKERENNEAEERRVKKAKAKDEYIDSEKKRAYGSDTIEKEREIISKLVYDLICNQLNEFIIPEDDELEASQKRKYLDKKILYMKRKKFFIGNMQDIVTKIFLYDIEYQMKKCVIGSAKYNELQEKYNNSKKTFEEMSENEDKLDDYLRYRIYNKLFASLISIFMTSADDNNPDEHNEMLMTVAKLRNEIEFYVFDKRKRIDDTMRVLMNYDDNKYRKIQYIFFSTLELTDKTTGDILDHDESQEKKLEKEKESLKCDIPN